MAITVDKVISVAEAEIGYLEKKTNSNLDSKTANAGSGNWTKYGRDLNKAGYYNGNKNGYAWCDQFVDYCFYIAAGKDKKAAEAAQCQTGPYGAGCGYSMQYYKDVGRFDKNPKKGDQIFFRYAGTTSGADHTGLVVAVTSSQITTIEGNSGDRVQKRTYSRNNSTIYGYGHPKYDTVPVTTTTVTQTVKETAPVSPKPVEKWNVMYVKKFQAWLNTNYGAGLSVNGAYNASTKRAAIKALQKYLNTNYGCGLDVDGDFGPKTKEATKKCNVKKGSQNKTVYILQGVLYGREYACNGFDGKCGDGCKSAIERFQKNKGLGVDGICGSKTWDALFNK